MELPEDLQASAFRSRGGTGEYAWQRPDAVRAAEFLASAGFAILGGELWCVSGHDIRAFFVAPDGCPAVLGWSTNRGDSESWTDFVTRALSESLAAIQTMPQANLSLPADECDVFYNLTWTDESRFNELRLRRKSS